MNREALLDKGERVFVGAVAFVLAMETLATIVGSGTQFAWPRLILGVFGGVFILYLAQKLYGGDRSVEKLALGWAGFQIALMAISLLVGPEPGGAGTSLIQSVGLPWRGLAILKLLAYATFAASLALRSSPRAFLAEKRGEDLATFLPETVVDASAPITWTAEQGALLRSLSICMEAAAVVLILVGIYLILFAVPPSLNVSRSGVIAIVEGLLVITLGALLVVPAIAMTGWEEGPLSSTGRLQAAVQKLTWWHMAAAGAVVILLPLTVLRFLLVWGST